MINVIIFQACLIPRTQLNIKAKNSRKIKCLVRLVLDPGLPTVSTKHELCLQASPGGISMINLGHFFFFKETELNSQQQRCKQ